jgi:hypothetical protein
MTNGGARASFWQWGCLALLIGGILLVIVTGMWLFSRPSPPPAGPRPTAIVWTASPTPTPTATPTPTPPPTSVAPPTEIGIGVRVQVRGTGAAGLNIRAEASTSAERLIVAAEGETFIVAAGPAQGDDLTWWFLRDEADPQREGWAAANYLIIAP